MKKENKERQDKWCKDLVGLLSVVKCIEHDDHGNQNIVFNLKGKEVSIYCNLCGGIVFDSRREEINAQVQYMHTSNV